MAGGLRDLTLPGGRRIAARWLSLRFARSGGAGGQNVNKVETKVDLRVDLAVLPRLVGAERAARARARLASRLDADGRLQVVADRARTRERNLQRALERGEALLAAALHEAPARRATRPSAGSRARRLDAKRARGARKRERRPPGGED